MRVLVSKVIVFFALLALIVGLFLTGSRQLVGEKTLVEVDGYRSWSDEVIEVAEGLLVQEGGRIKPLQTRADFAMLQMRGDRRMKIQNEQGEKITIKPTAWMLDLFFRPEIAAELPTFRVDNGEVLKAMGIEFTDRKKRDRYSFKELEPNLANLMKKAGDFQELKSRGSDLSPVEEQTLDLANAVQNYFYLTHYFDFVREGIILRVEEGEGKKVAMSTVMASAGQIAAAIREAQQSGRGVPTHVNELLRQVDQSVNRSRFNFHPIPPYEVEDKKWFSVGELIEGAITGKITNSAAALADVQSLEQLYESFEKGEPEFLKSLQTFRVTILERAGEDAAKSVAAELSFNKRQWFKNSLYLFGLGGLFVLGCLFSPTGGIGKLFRMGVWAFSALGFFFIIAGVIHRFLVVGRPPVTNLYETIPFITAGSVFLILLSEFFTRGRIALVVAPIVGLGGMVLALVFEVAAASDSFDPLVAVLRSNFWLTTHVLTVTLGYAAGLVAAVFGFVYILMCLLGLDEGSKKIRRDLTRMTYGIICFTLLLSLIGTVLGGIWANYSWGRFWGWDPKENGALMIVLWSLFILHGRAGGFLREWGVNLAAAFGGVVVTFSWFHVNMLGTGLHSYGFTDGKSAIWVFYAVACLTIVAGMIYASYEGRSASRKKGS